MEILNIYGHSVVSHKSIVLKSLFSPIVLLTAHTVKNYLTEGGDISRWRRATSAAAPSSTMPVTANPTQPIQTAAKKPNPAATSKMPSTSSARITISLTNLTSGD